MRSTTSPCPNTRSSLGLSSFSSKVSRSSAPARVTTRSRESLLEPIVDRSSPNRARPRISRGVRQSLYPPAFPRLPLALRSRSVRVRVFPGGIGTIEMVRNDPGAASSAEAATYVVADCSVCCPSGAPACILPDSSSSDTVVAACASTGAFGFEGFEGYGRLRHSWDPVRWFPGQARFLISLHPLHCRPLLVASEEQAPLPLPPSTSEEAKAAALQFDKKLFRSLQRARP